jgi:hypothetical protein
MLAAMVAVAGCGAPPPEAPLPQAKKLDASTSDLATECGLTYQVTAFGGDHAGEVSHLESLAAVSVHSLASVYARNPAWIYQGETIRQIVADAVAMLEACGLKHAAGALELSAAGSDRAARTAR